MAHRKRNRKGTKMGGIYVGPAAMTNMREKIAGPGFSSNKANTIAREVTGRRV
jgi:hypothetical protein